jgi:hypothetical protein
MASNSICEAVIEIVSIGNFRQHLPGNFFFSRTIAGSNVDIDFSVVFVC